MGGEVTVSQVEPGVHAELAQHFEGGEGVAGQSPAGLLVIKTREGIHHGVKVRGYVEAVEGLVVAGVDADHQVIGRKTEGETQSQLGPADASRKCQHSRWAERPFRSYHGRSPLANGLEKEARRLNCGIWIVGMLKPIGVQLDQPVVRSKHFFHVIADQVQRV